MYQVIGTQKSRAFRAIWMLEELGQPYQLLETAPRAPTSLAHNPSGKVPVLLVDGAPIIDSTAILTYLADKHGALSHPAGTLERARQDALTQFVLDEFDAILWTAARHSFVLPQDMRLPEIKPSLKWEFERSQGFFLHRLGDGPFLMGDVMTIADILACHCADWAVVSKFPILDGFASYASTLRQRPAYQRARAK